MQWPEHVVYSAHELKLIRGTFELMARIGAQQLSLRRTARELGVSPGLLKYHFGNHEKLLAETMRWALQEGLGRVRGALENLSDPIDALAAIVDEIYSSPETFRQYQLISLDMAQYLARHPKSTELAALMQTQTKLYAAVIQAGADSGVFQVDDLDVAVFQMRSVMLGSGQLWVQRIDWEGRLPEMRASTFDAIVTLLGCASASR